MECFLLGYNDAPFTLLSSAILSLSDSLSFDEDDGDVDDEEGSIAVTSVKGLAVDVVDGDVICCLEDRGRVEGTGVMGGTDDTVTGTVTEPGFARNQGVWESDEGIPSTWGDFFFFGSDCTFCICPCPCPSPCTLMVFLSDADAPITGLLSTLLPFVSKLSSTFSLSLGGVTGILMLSRDVMRVGL